MGMCGELCARKYNISRAEQDKFAALSYQRAHSAHKAGKFDRNFSSPCQKST